MRRRQCAMHDEHGHAHAGLSILVYMEFCRHFVDSIMYYNSTNPIYMEKLLEENKYIATRPHSLMSVDFVVFRYTGDLIRASYCVVLSLAVRNGVLHH